MKTTNSLKTWIVHGSQSFHCPLKNPKLVSSKCSRDHFGGGRGGGDVIHLLPIKFPPGCRLILNDEEDESDDDILSELATCKAVLSADPGLSPDDYVVVVIYGWDKSLAFIKSGDKDWTGVDHKRFGMTCQDVVVNNYPRSTFRTSGFKDFRLVWLGYLSTWVEMKSLGKRVLFLGESHSTCISSWALPSLEPNSIYFTDDILA